MTYPESETPDSTPTLLPATSVATNQSSTSDKAPTPTLPPSPESMSTKNKVQVVSGIILHVVLV